MFAALILFFASSLADPKSVCLPASIQAIFAALIVLIWLQWAGGLIIYSGDALVSSLFLTGIGLAWLLGARTAFVSCGQANALILAGTLVVIAACASSLMAVLQWLNQEEGMWFFVAERGLNRPYANLAQPNLLATLLVMGVVFAYLLYLRQRIRTWQLLAITVCLSFGLIVTESRAGLLSTLCLGVFFLVRAKSGWRVGGWRVVAVWWCLLVALASLWHPLNELLELPPTRQAAMGVDGIRIVIWKQVIVAITQAPWLGYGWRQTVIAQKIGVEMVPGSLQTDYAHNVILDVLAWVGLPLGVLLLTLGAWWVWRTIRDMKDSTEFLLFAATIPFLVHSMVEFPFAYAFFLFPIAWIFGFLHARQMPGRFTGTPVAPLAKRSAMIIGLFCFAILCGAVLREYLAAEEDFRVMRFEMRKLGSRALDYEAPDLILLTQLDDLLKMGRMQPKRGMSATEMDRLRKANLSRYWGALDMKYIIALGINGQPDEATKQLGKLKALYGPELYHSAVDELRTLRDEKYPELALINAKY